MTRSYFQVSLTISFIRRKLKSTDNSSSDQHTPQTSGSAKEMKNRPFDVSAQNGEQYDNIPNYITILPDPPIVQYQNTPDVINNVASEEIKYEDVVNVEQNNRSRTNQDKYANIENETGGDNEEEEEEDEDDDNVYCCIDDKEIRSYKSPADNTREVEADKQCIVLKSNNYRHSKV